MTPHAAAPPALNAEQIEAIARSQFTGLGLSQQIVRAVLEEEYSIATPVQTQVIPEAARGRDVLALAQTGTGKTAAFVLPILEMLSRAEDRSDAIRVLILTPTRELAAQIDERVGAYGRYLGIRHAVIYGGVSQQRQEIALSHRPRVLVATPGRLLDLMNQGFVKLDEIRHFVLDEADRMLDMGFVHDVRRVTAALPKQRQTLLFSATMPDSVEALAQGLLRDPARVNVTPKVAAAETVEQAVVFVERAQKSALLEQMLRSDEVERAIVFTRTKHGANKVSRRLEQVGIDAPAIHGNKSQGARERALGDFRAGKSRVLIATDIAARGIDVTDISHVINFDLPDVAESYVHRIGRTGRAGATGRAISFCERDERTMLREIERLIRKPLAVLDGGAFGIDLQAAASSTAIDSRDQRPQRIERRQPASPHANRGHRQAVPAQSRRGRRRRSAVSAAPR